MLTAFDQRLEEREHETVEPAKLRWGLAGVDPDESMEPAEFPPSYREHPLQSFGGIVAVGLGRRHRLSYLGYGALGDGFDQRFPGREVDVDGGANEAGAASDLGHAGFGIARKCVE